MGYRKYPNSDTVNESIRKKEALLIAISFDGETALIKKPPNHLGSGKL